MTNQPKVKETRFESANADYNATLKLDELMQRVKEFYPGMNLKQRLPSYKDDYRRDQITSFAELAYATLTAGVEAVKEQKIPRDIIHKYSHFFENDLTRRLHENEKSLGRDPITHKRNLGRCLYLSIHPREKRTYEACKKVLQTWAKQFGDLTERIAAMPGEKNEFTFRED